MNKCEECSGNGWLDSNNAEWQDETQRCDFCKVYKSDFEAQKAKEVTA